MDLDDRTSDQVDKADSDERIQSSIGGFYSLQVGFDEFNWGNLVGMYQATGFAYIHGPKLRHISKIHSHQTRKKETFGWESYHPV